MSVSCDLLKAQVVPGSSLCLQVTSLFEDSISSITLQKKNPFTAYCRGLVQRVKLPKIMAVRFKK